MQHGALLVCTLALLVGGAAGGYYGALAASGAAPTSVAADAQPAAPARPVVEGRAGGPYAALPAAAPLGWSELLAPGSVLAPSARAKALAGKRVRMVGFMARMELPTPGAFYLVPRPIACDEAGAGTADLMPASVLVLSESASGKDVAFVPGALAVSGVLEVGNQAGDDGRVSAFRLRLDRTTSSAPVEPVAAANTPR
jgi:hypothetical protein